MTVLYAGEPVDTMTLTALLVCLIPTALWRNLLTYGAGGAIVAYLQYQSRRAGFETPGPPEGKGRPGA